MSNVKPSNLSTTTMATQTSELRQQVNAQPQKLAIPQPRSFNRGGGKSTTTVNRPQDQKQAPRNDGLQRVVTALKQEILDLKKGQNNLQSVTELKYIKGRVSSLEKSLAERDGTIATLRREKAELELRLASYDPSNPAIKPASQEDVDKAIKILETPAQAA